MCSDRDISENRHSTCKGPEEACEDLQEMQCTNTADQENQGK